MMSWFGKKAPKANPNPMHKYVERLHWNKLQDHFALMKQGEIDTVIEAGLAYRNGVNHTGEALLLFESFFLANKYEHLTLRRHLCEKFIEDIFDGFDKSDRQYLLDVAAFSMRLHHWEDSKNDKIHQITNRIPI